MCASAMNGLDYAPPPSSPHFSSFSLLLLFMSASSRSSFSDSLKISETMAA